MPVWQSHSMDLHERLKAAREYAGFESATLAAEALGVRYPTYAGHENGSSGFRSATGEIYARKFKVRFEWLMRGRGPMIESAPALSGVDAEIAQLLPTVPEDEKKAYLAWLKSRYGLEDTATPQASAQAPGGQRLLK